MKKGYLSISLVFFINLSGEIFNGKLEQTITDIYLMLCFRQKL
jgi:hypothetical protein